MICWCDDVFLILIHGFALLLVDLAFPQFFPVSIHEISPILPLKSSISAPKLSSSSSSSDLEPGYPARSPGHLAPRTSGPWLGHPAPGAHIRARFWTSGPENPARAPDVRPLAFQPSPFHRFVHNFHIRSPIVTFFSSLSSY